MELVKVPAVFFYDHKDRDLDTPAVVKENRTHVWVDTDDPAIPELLNDAEYYAHPYGPDMSIGFRSSARATVKALMTIPGVKDRPIREVA